MLDIMFLKNRCFKEQIIYLVKNIYFYSQFLPHQIFKSFAYVESFLIHYKMPMQ